MSKYIDFADRLKTLQRKVGIKTQLKFSEYLGVSPSIVSVWMRGFKPPAMATAITIANKTGCTTEWLLKGNGTKEDRPEEHADISFLTDEQKDIIKSMIKEFELVASIKKYLAQAVG